MVDDFERERLVAYEQAQLVSFAFNQPKDMPKYKPLPLSSRVNQEAKPTKYDEDRVRAIFKSMAKYKE